MELELSRGNWDKVNIAAMSSLGGLNSAFWVLSKYLGSVMSHGLEPNSPEVLALRGLVLFLSAKLPQALQHVQSALRYDPAHEQAQKLRKRVKDRKAER